MIEGLRPGVNSLTRVGNNPTLKSEGKFMAQEGRTIQDDTAKRTEMSAEDAQKLWEEQNKAREKRGEKISAEERETQRILAQMGRGPMEGANDNPDQPISDPKLTPFLSDMRKLFSAEKFDPKKAEELQGKILGTEPPEGYTSGQKDEFREQRAFLLGDLAEQIVQMQEAIKRPDTKEVVTRLNALIEAIQTEGPDVYDKIDEITAPLDINDYLVYGPIIKRVVEQVKGKDHLLEYLLVRGVERILTTADANPLEQYPRFNLYQETNLDMVIQTARRYDEGRGGLDKSGMFKYLSDLRTKRYVMHELFRSMKSREDYVKLVTQLLRKEGMAFVEREIPGVSDVKQMYEEFLGSDLSLVKGWLTGQNLSEIDEAVERHLNYCIKQHPESYQVEQTPNRKAPKRAKRALREWEVKRAVYVARSLHAASLRRYTYSVLGDLPTDPALLYKSVEAEYLSRILAPLKLLPMRFFDSPVAKHYLDMVFHEMQRKSMKDGREEKDLRKYGYIGDSGEEKGVYGKKQRSLAMLDTSITDPQSNSWRSVNLFLRQKGYLTEDFDGEKMTIGEYLFAIHEAVENEFRHRAEAGRAVPMTDSEWDELKKDKRMPYREAIKKEINTRVKEAIKRQRLFLGTLMRHGDLDDDNKKIIWGNVAEFLPSRMAAFMPEEAMAIVSRIYGVDKKDAIKLWTKGRNGGLPLREKLWILERARIKKDAESLKKNTADERKPQGDSLLAYSEGVDLSPQETELIKAFQEMGREKVRNNEFIKIKFPYTAFLDDAPQTAWEEIEDDDFDRILIGDHNNYEKGWSKVVSVIANAGMKPEDVVQDFNEAFDSIQQPPGKATAQEKLWPFINAYLKMARLNKAATWAGALMQLSRIPRSEMEKYNLQSKIAYDEQQTEKIITGLAQHETVSDVPVEADETGQTQYMIMKSDNDADRKAVFLAYLRMVLQLLLPILGKEFFKMILPGNLAKDLGL